MEKSLGYDPIYSQVGQTPQRFVRRALSGYWVVIVVIALFTSMAGGAFAMRQPHHYTSHVEILVQPLSGNAFSPDMLGTPQQVTIGMETEANLVSAPDVTARVSKALGKAARADAGKAAAEVVLNSQILRISYTASSPPAAQRGAVAFAGAILSSRQARARAVRHNTLSGLEKELASLRRSLGAASEAAMSTTPTAADKAQLQLLTSRMVTCQEQLGEARAISTGPGSIVGSVSVPKAIERFLPYAFGITAAIVGFGLGLGVALLRVRMDDRIDSRYDLRVAGVPVWADLGCIADTANSDLAGDSSRKEAYRRLRAAVISNVDFSSVVAVVSHETMPQTTDVAANLAISLNELGYRTALVDSEIHRPRVVKLLGLSPMLGLSDVVTGTVEAVDAVVDYGGVSVLGAGSSLPAVKDRCSGAPFRSLVDISRDGSDFTFVTADLSTGIGSAIAGIADHAVLVVLNNVTTHKQIGDVINRVRMQNVRVAGLVTVSCGSVQRGVGKNVDRERRPARRHHGINARHSDNPATSHVHAAH